MEGVVHGVYLCNQDRTTQLSDRMFARNVPGQPMPSVFDPRPAETRYVKMPMLDCRRPTTVPCQQMPIYNTNTMFSPGTSLPFDGFQNNIDTESKLDNIFFPIQKCPQAKFVPGSQSDLYNNRYLTQTSRPVRMTNPLLFKQEQFAPFNPNLCGTGHKMFNNFTKLQVRDLDYPFFPSSSPHNHIPIPGAVIMGGK